MLFQKKTKILIGASILSVYLAIFFSAKVFSSNNLELQVSFLNVGQGDSVYVKAPNGKDMLIDGGRTSGVLLKKLKNVMAPGDKKIDVVIATHPDADHIGGLQSVVENFEVGEFVESGVSAETKVYKNLLDSLALRKVPHLVARTGTTISLEEEKIIFTILSPDFVTEGEDTNEASVSGLLSFGEQTFMLTGDAPTSVEEKIVKNGINNNLNKTKINEINMSTDVLKLGHHGSRSATSDNFLKATNPSIAIVSAGCDNTYGHPHKEVIDKLAILKIKTISTCDSGTITFFTDGKTLSTKTEK